MVSSFRVVVPVPGVTGTKARPLFAWVPSIHAFTSVVTSTVTKVFFEVIGSEKDARGTTSMPGWLDAVNVVSVHGVT